MRASISGVTALGSPRRASLSTAVSRSARLPVDNAASWLSVVISTAASARATFAFDLPSAGLASSNASAAATRSKAESAESIASSARGEDSFFKATTSAASERAEESALGNARMLRAKDVLDEARTSGSASSRRARSPARACSLSNAASPFATSKRISRLAEFEVAPKACGSSLRGFANRSSDGSERVSANSTKD